MKKPYCLIAGLVLAAGAVVPSIATAQAEVAAQHGQCERELDQAIEALSHAFEARDLDAFMAPFLDDAVQVNTLGEVFEGKPEITEFYRAVMANDYAFSSTLVAKTLDQCSSAIVADRVEFVIPAAGVVVHAIDVATWVRVRGQWKLSADTTTRIARP